MRLFLFFPCAFFAVAASFMLNSKNPKVRGTAEFFLTMLFPVSLLLGVIFSIMMKHVIF